MGGLTTSPSVSQPRVHPLPRGLFAASTASGISAVEAYFFPSSPLLQMILFDYLFQSMVHVIFVFDLGISRHLSYFGFKR
jgi:hypothetical protein